MSWRFADLFTAAVEGRQRHVTSLGSEREVFSVLYRNLTFR